MVRRDVIALRLEKLSSYLQTIRAVQRYDLDRFKKDPFIHGTAERYLHLSIECLLDIGNHLIADRGYRKPTTYGEIPKILAEEGVIGQDLADRMTGMAAFRNILVHDYLELDLAKIYRLIQERLGDLDELAAIYAKLI